VLVFNFAPFFGAKVRWMVALRRLAWCFFWKDQVGEGFVAVAYEIGWAREIRALPGGGDR
jgi:hypothetical protein